MTHPCLVVLTARGPDRLIAEHGTQAWRLKPENVRRLSYCVCVQNRHNGHWGGADQEHHHAFMVGRIKDVVVSPERSDRYLVVFSEYARIDKPKAWQGLRNPVSYRTLEDFGITDPESLQWWEIPNEPAQVSASEVEDEEENGFGPLTIAEAKAGLALGLGVPETAIEITVKF